MRSTYSHAAAVAAGLFVSSASAGFSAGSSSNVAIYWGQGNAQIDLSTACADDSVDIVNVAFVNQFPKEIGDYPSTNFANACGSEKYLYPDGTESGLLSNCPGIGPGIKTCQANGKKVLLSIGGGWPTDYYLESTEIAEYFAEFLWGAFGPQTDSWVADGKPRPFGDAAVDGFDLDIESFIDPAPFDGYQYANYGHFVSHLKNNLFPTGPGSYYISGAPQCVIPDARLADAIATSSFDFVFVQFYNTPECSARAGYDGLGTSSTDFTFDAWVSWLGENSANSGAKIYLGLPAGEAGAPSDTPSYLKPEEANELISYYAQKHPDVFGGVMLWEATVSAKNKICDKAYSVWIKNILVGEYSAPTCASSTSSVASSTSSTSTSTSMPTATGGPSPDGSCGGVNGYTCIGYNMGECCSQWGWCGGDSDYCDAGCQSPFGKCNSASSSSTGSSTTSSASSTSSSSVSTSTSASTSSSSVVSSSSSSSASSTSSASSSATSSASSSSSSVSSSSSSASASSSASSSSSSSHSQTSSASSSASTGGSSASSSSVYSTGSSSSSHSSVLYPTGSNSTSSQGYPTGSSSSSTIAYPTSSSTSCTSSTVGYPSASSSSTIAYPTSSSTSCTSSTVGYPSASSSSVVYSTVPYPTGSNSTGSYPTSYPSSSSEGYPVYPTSSSSVEYPVYPASSSTPCSSSTKGYPTSSTQGYPVYPASSSSTGYPVYSASSSSKGYPVYSASSSSKGYPVYPTGPEVTSKPSYPTEKPTTVYATTYTTTYVDICSTGLTTKTTTVTKTIYPTDTEKTPSPTDVPEGWYVTVTVCKHCGPAYTTVTLTKPADETKGYPVPTYPTYPEESEVSKSYEAPKPSAPAYVPEAYPEKPEAEEYESETATSVVYNVITLTKVPIPASETPASYVPYVPVNSTAVYPTGTASSTGYGSYPTYTPPQFEGAASRFGVGMSALAVIVAGVLAL